MAEDIGYTSTSYSRPIFSLFFVLFFVLKIDLFCSVYTGILPARVSVHRMSAALTRCQQREADPPELELPMVVSCPVGAGDGTWALCKQPVCLTPEPSLQTSLCLVFVCLFNCSIFIENLLYFCL